MLNEELSKFKGNCVTSQIVAPFEADVEIASTDVLDVVVV